MHKLLFSVAFISICHLGFSQRRSTRPPSLADSSIPKYIPIPRIPTVEVEIKKYDSSKIANVSNYKVFTLSVFNNSDSTICILFSFYLDESVKGQVFPLDPVYDCYNDTLKYYSLEHCKYWDIGYSPLPAKPLLVSPNTYLNTSFSIEMKPDMPKEFHLHYANIDLTYSEMVKAYQKDRHNWQGALSIKCKRVVLPD